MIDSETMFRWIQKDGERQIVACPDGEIPDGYDDWVELSKEEVDSILLLNRKDELVIKLKELRNHYEFGSISTPQGDLQVDENSQRRLSLTLHRARKEENYTTDWRMLDNTWEPVDLETLEAWNQLIAENTGHIFAHYGKLLDDISSAKSLEKLEAIDVKEGWTFQPDVQ